MRMKKGLCVLLCTVLTAAAVPMSTYAQDAAKDADTSYTAETVSSDSEGCKSTEQQLADIADVDEAVTAIMKSEELLAASVSERKAMVIALLDELTEQGLVSDYTVPEEEYIYCIEFTYKCGAGGIIEYYRLPGTDGIGETEEAGITGDINGDGRLSMTDTISIQKYILGKSQLSQDALVRADVCSDGRVNCFDIAALKKLIIEAVDSFEYTIEFNQHFDCYFEYETGDAVITSTEEMAEFLVTYISGEALSETYLTKYDEAFFEENVLLLCAMFQSCGGSVCYDIDNIDACGNTLNIIYSDTYFYDRCYEDVCSEVIAQIIIPKEKFVFDSVIWDCLVID